MKTPPTRTRLSRHGRRLAVLGALVLGGIAGAQGTPAPAAAPGDGLKPFKQEIPGSTVAFDMVPVPAGIDSAGNPRASFWIGKCEVTWDEYDIFAFRLDLPDGVPQEEIDAKTHPTKPYLAADHGFGHAGYPVISVAYKGAEAYCKWLSAKTGRKYRLPTEDEWEFACRAGTTTQFPTGDDPKTLDAAAWHKENSEAKSHGVAEKKPNAWGVHDMLGNVSEWATSKDGKPVTKGGSYKDDPENLTPGRAVPNNKAWNASDPQIPKSPWWLADGGFVGFRVVCESETK